VIEKRTVWSGSPIVGGEAELLSGGEGWREDSKTSGERLCRSQQGTVLVYERVPPRKASDLLIGLSPIISPFKEITIY